MSVHLRPVTKENLGACLAIEMTPEGSSRVASVAKSLAQAYVDANLHPYAVYDAAARGQENTEEPVVGFAMLEVAAGVGFVLRLIVDARHQGRGVGRAMMVELIRRARLFPDVEAIGTSHARGNEPMVRLCASLGFVPWALAGVDPKGSESFLILGPDA